MTFSNGYIVGQTLAYYDDGSYDIYSKNVIQGRRCVHGHIIQVDDNMVVNYGQHGIVKHYCLAHGL